MRRLSWCGEATAAQLHVITANYSKKRKLYIVTNMSPLCLSVISLYGYNPYRLEQARTIGGGVKFSFMWRKGANYSYIKSKSHQYITDRNIHMGVFIVRLSCKLTGMILDIAWKLAIRAEKGSNRKKNYVQWERGEKEVKQKRKKELTHWVSQKGWPTGPIQSLNPLHHAVLASDLW